MSDSHATMRGYKQRSYPHNSLTLQRLSSQLYICFFCFTDTGLACCSLGDCNQWVSDVGVLFWRSNRIAVWIPSLCFHSGIQCVCHIFDLAGHPLRIMVQLPYFEEYCHEAKLATRLLCISFHQNNKKKGITWRLTFVLRVEFGSIVVLICALIILGGPVLYIIKKVACCISLCHMKSR